MSLARPPLSAVIIAKNAVRQLPECLESLAFFDEILVVDSGSMDGSVELALACGARVIEAEWRGFGPQKRYAVAQAAHDWVLCVDADERVSPELRSAIEQALAAPANAAYRFPRRNRFLGRYLRHGEGYPDWTLRLFHRDHGNWSEDMVHEKVLTVGPVGRLSGDLLHESDTSIADYLDKQNRYTSLQARALYARGQRASVAKIALSPPLRFVKFYFLRLGFLDGIPGLAHIAIGCVNTFVKYAKLFELQRRAADQRPDATEP